MRCLRCGLENPPVAAFCMRCGQQLQVESTGAPGPAAPAGAQQPTALLPKPGTTPGAAPGAQKPPAPGPGGLPAHPGGQPPAAKPPAPAARKPAPSQPSGPSVDEEEEALWATMREPIPEFPAAAPIPKPEPPPPPPEPPVDASSQMTVPLGVVPPGMAPAESGLPRQVDKIVCPNCYAVNAPGNNFCRECGNPLPKPTAPAAKPMPPSAVLPVPPSATPGPLPVSGMTTGPLPPSAPIPPAGPEPIPAAPAEKARAQRQIGPADALAVLSLLAIVLALVPLFQWAKVAGRSIWAFTYQGPTSGTAGPGFPGGPGVLPYAGWEWLTLGLIGALAGALALFFLVLRVGRGPMFTLAGCLCLFPFAYHFTQSLVPLRAHGIEFTRGVGFKSLFFGISGSGYGGLGPPVWLLLGAGILLIVAGFLAPPRALTRLLSFSLFFLLAMFLAAFTAVCYNFNLFIPETLARVLGGG